MHISDTITRTHQFWAATYHILGLPLLSKTYKVSHRQIQRWAADPDFCDQTQRNPLDHIITVCRRLQEVSRDDVVEAGLRRLLEPLGYSLHRSEIKSDKKSIALELLDVGRVQGTLISTYQEANVDFNISPDEQAALLSQADDLLQEIEELKDAIRHGKEVGDHRD